MEFAIPPSHPYTRVSGALLVGEAAFVLAHECAHFLLGHTTEEPRVITESSDGVLMPYEYAQRFMGEEIEADRLAAELTKSYLSIHEDDFIKDVGMVGPALFFHWLGFCETLIGSVFLERWQHDVLRMAFAEPYLDKIGENVLLCLHAHPLGTERSKEYLSSVSWDQVSDFTRAVVDASAGIAEHFIADAKNQDRLRAILGERG